MSLPFRPVRRKQEEPPVPEIVHPNREEALKAVKKAVKSVPESFFGTATLPDGRMAFNVYVNSKVVERHVAGQ